MILVRDKISPRRFIVGGAAILPADIRNHHMARAGKMLSMPLVRIMLRVLVDS